MRIAHHSALAFCPFKNWQGPAGPFFNGLCTGIIIFLEPEQYYMAGMRGRKARYFNIIPHDIILSRKRADLTGEIFLLMIPTGSPGQHCSDIKVFTKNLSPHVHRRNSLFSAFIVTAASGMHVMVGTIPSQFGHMYPPLKFEWYFN